MRRGGPSDFARRADGAALLATLLAMTLMTVLASTLILVTITEAAVAATYRDGIVTRYVAEGAAERAIAAARATPDWRMLAARSVQWTFAETSGSALVTATAASLDGGVETLELTARATGPDGIVRTVIVLVSRDNMADSGQIRVLSWRETP